VDRSKAFLSQARAGAAAGEEYLTADVAVAPLRIAGLGAQPDLIYARFLSSHLPEPEQAVAGWAKELAAGGLLLLEEVDSISTEVAAFDEYLKIASEVLAQYGNELFVGARLATSRWEADLWIEVNRTAEVRPSTGQAARMQLPAFADQHKAAFRRSPASPERRIELGETPMRRLKARLNAASDW
jgi:hypothetical protein